MNRTLFCHMMMTLDGKITGNHSQFSETKKGGELYYEYGFTNEAPHPVDAWISGRSTAQKHFTDGNEPELTTDHEAVPDGDFIVDTDFDHYYVVLDGHGRVDWPKDTIEYNEFKAKVVVVVTEETSDDYKAFLRNKNIPYVIAGQSEIGLNDALDRLQQNFPMESFMVGGGAKLNWSFIKAGLCDELSLVVSPILEGDPEAIPFALPNRENDSTEPVPLELISNDTIADSTIYLRYKVKND
ncbi:dihydrofolate reductase family protein [Staphylococcus auricularis]|uniref:dihydrofolate reductase family protein n=1 Tax=Staphylococcus auricularis TaxID=29379 RepID=UPI003EB83E11